LVARRRFFERLGWFGIAALALTSIPATIRFLMPRGARSGTSWFDAGTRQDYRDEVVSTKWVRRHRVWVVRDQRGLFVLQAHCTHLGCTPRWEPETLKFRCPCHGSMFSLEGTALNGPAKDPLRRVAIWERRDRILIDPEDNVTLEDAEAGERYYLSI
jgi:cytochrome b6-f complex iron-sulfur subunit